MQLDLFTHSTPRTRGRAEVPEASAYLPVYRVQLVHETVIPANRPQLGSSTDVARLLQQFLHQVDREHFVVILVDRKNRLIGIHTVSVGSLTASVVVW